MADQSFRNSFYESGTDWSCLYEADEYGIPVGEGPGYGTNFVLEEDFEQNEEGIREIDETGSAKGAFEGEFRGRMRASLQREEMRVQEGAKKNPVLRMVQTDLSGFLGLKLGPSAAKGKRQQDIGPFFGVAALPREETVRAKSRRVVESSSVSGKPETGQAGSGKMPWGKKNGYRGGSENDRQRVMRSCPFYKKILGRFTVDAFRFGAVEGCSAYFLTHFHADHYGGLTKWWSHGPIYCTPITARLLVLCLSVSSQWIHPIEVGTTEMVDGVEVKMLEANHCPGAALILFTLQTGARILHTGDFRACKAMQLYPELVNSRINTLYLDTTYCNPSYTFPLQDDAIEFAIKVTKDSLRQNSRTLIVVGAYSIGKERVYLGIAEALGVKIFADRYRMRVLSSMRWPRLSERLSDDAKTTMLHVLPISHLNPPRLKKYLQGLPRFTSLLAFRPTGWTYSQKVGNKLDLIRPNCSGPITIYGVPYSEHSSFVELQEFVQFLRPDNIIPTVNVGRAEERDRMQSLFRHWLKS